MFFSVFVCLCLKSSFCILINLICFIKKCLYKNVFFKVFLKFKQTHSLIVWATKTIIILKFFYTYFKK